MYLNMPRFTFLKKCAIVAAILMTAASGIASTDIPNADAPKTLKENIATPEVPKKYSPAIQRHMGNNANQFARHNLEVAMHRKNEVYSIIIPCDTLFKPNDDELRTHAPYYLNAFKELLHKPTSYKILVVVYSDNTGSEQYCDDLTERRANAIADYFDELAGDVETNITSYGMGAEEPRSANTSVKNRRRNRRVEIYVVPEDNVIKRARTGTLN